MGENKMKEVVKLLNVEIGEKFLVYNAAGELVGKHKFDDKNLWLISGELMGSVNQHLIYLLTGTWTIKKLPWKPKNGELYYTFGERIVDEIIILSYRWSDLLTDYLRYRNGFCYKTREEAEANKSKAEEYFNNDEIVDWEKTND